MPKFPDVVMKFAMCGWTLIIRMVLGQNHRRHMNDCCMTPCAEILLCLHVAMRQKMSGLLLIRCLPIGPMNHCLSSIRKVPGGRMRPMTLWHETDVAGMSR